MQGLVASSSTLATGSRADRAAILQQLAAALEYEKNSDWENVKGQRMFFSEHLVRRALPGLDLPSGAREHHSSCPCGHSKRTS